ncbi:MAG: hypothetical protein RLY57_113 [Candidatus Parcubacteria bacterium]|jgi:hypothetical protein
MSKELQLLPNDPGEPLFETEEAYENFREWFCNAVREPLDASRWQRALSEHEARTRWVN